MIAFCSRCNSGGGKKSGHDGADAFVALCTAILCRVDGRTYRKRTDSKVDAIWWSAANRGHARWESGHASSTSSAIKQAE